MHWGVAEVRATGTRGVRCMHGGEGREHTGHGGSEDRGHTRCSVGVRAAGNEPGGGGLRAHDGTAAERAAGTVARRRRGPRTCGSWCRRRGSWAHEGYGGGASRGHSGGGGRGIRSAVAAGTADTREYGGGESRGQRALRRRGLRAHDGVRVGPWLHCRCRFFTVHTLFLFFFFYMFFFLHVRDALCVVVVGLFF